MRRDATHVSVRIAPMPLTSPGFDAVIDAYLAAFDVPPERPEARAEAEAMFRRHAGYPGWRGLVALGPGDEVLGFAYGYTSTPGQFYRGKLEAALGPDLSARWLSDCFEFVELGVVPPARRRGIAGRLHDALLAGTGHRTAVLTTWVTNTPARALYESRGWQVILEPWLPAPDGEPYVIMGLDLGGRGDG